jgi:ABC-type multidrug transport system fused ATPase/permease subunit
MFVRPFLKYFRPFLARLALAVAGMVLVGGLTAAPLLIAREAIRVLLYSNPALAEQLESSTRISAEKKRLLKGLLATEADGGESGEPQTVEEALRAWAASAGMRTEAVANDPGLTDEQKRLLIEALSPPAEGVGDPAPAADDKPPLRMRIDVWLTDHLGAAWTAPRNMAQAVAGRFQAWYNHYASISPLHALGFLVILLIVLTVVKGAAEFVSKYQLAYTFFFTSLHVREDIFRNVLCQDFLYFSRHSAGYLYSRINQDSKELKTVIDGTISDGVQQPITLVCMFTILMLLSWQLTFGVMLVLPLIGALLYYMARVLRKNTRKQKRKSDELSSSLTESLNNIRLVKAFGAEQSEIDKFHSRSMALFRYIMARRTAKFGASPLMELLGSLAVGGVIMFGGWMILSSPPRMSFEDYLIYLITLSRFYGPIKKLATLTNKFQIAKVSCERMTEMLNLRPKVREDPQAAGFERVREAIEFQNVGFLYGREPVLSQVNMRVPADSRVAFAGASGSGKTTLINLLVRLFDPVEGRILVDGTDLRKLKLTDWRRHLAIVTQDTYLFDDTVAGNIAYGSDALDREKVEAAARAANAHDFIMELDGGKGYETKIGPMGVRLSGGQRQRLAIARAIYRDPRILVLDEATSALDSRSQALVQEALGRLMEGRTTFVVAHRISTIRHVDRIYVLDGGRIAESGTHDELMARDGLYAALAARSSLVETTPEEPPQAVAALDVFDDDEDEE